MRTFARIVTTAVVLAAPLQGQRAASGPAPSDGPAADGVATLALWAEEVWISILDRNGSWFGRLAEEGLFQRFNGLLDDEYELDVRTALFTPAEDARWSRVRNGLRAAGASISHPHVLNVVDWRQEIPVAEGVDLLALYRRDHSLTARRDYPRVGIRWREVLGSPWTAGATLGVHFLKPSIDLELALSRSWAEAGGGGWGLEVRMAALDAFNNTIFGALGVGAEDVEAHLDYRTPPFAARFGLRRVSPRWLLEIHGGSSNRSEVEATFPAASDPPFTQREQVRFGGMMVQAGTSETLVVAVYGRLARADTERRMVESGPGGFTLRETTASVGAYPRLRLTGTLAIAAEIHRIWRPEDRTAEEPAPDGAGDVEHRDRTTFVQVALDRRPESGWTGRLAWAYDGRDAGPLAPQLNARNHRLVVAGGYRFASGFEVTAGLGWDLDRLRRRPFDGGHLRFAGTW